MVTREGIVIKRMDYKETSKIVFLYTDTGRDSFLIHGANKISSPHLAKTEIANRLKVILQGKGLKIATEIDVLDTYFETKADLVKFTYLSHVLEIINHVCEAEIDHGKLYGFLLKIMEKIDHTDNYIPYVYMFEAKLLYLLGIQPELKACVICQGTDIAGFSIADGGVVCKNHLPKSMFFPAELIRPFASLYYHDVDKNDAPAFETEVIILIRKLIDEYYQYHLNFKTKAREMLEKLIGY